MITDPPSREPRAGRWSGRGQRPSLPELRRMADALSATVTTHLIGLRRPLTEEGPVSPSERARRGPGRTGTPPMSDHRARAAGRLEGPKAHQFRPGQVAYDPASERRGVLQAIHQPSELLFDPKVTGTHIAFLRPEGGGVEWTADADSLQRAK